MTFAEIVKNGCNEWNLPITDEAVTRMERFSDALIEKNRVMNLTAVTEPEEIARRHMLDCLFLLTVTEFKGKKVLDIGCGWGAIGVAIAKANKIAKVTMVDVNRRALDLCRQNCQRNGVTAEVIESDGMAEVMGRKFDAIVTNPPIRAGKQVIYKMFADAAQSLNLDGALYLVIRKQQGAESCVKYLKTLFNEVEKLDKSGGFWVLKAYDPKEAETDEV